MSAQTIDTLPTFRRFCQNSFTPDSIKTYSYTTSIVISSDTTITSDWWIGRDSVLIIPKGFTVSFAQDVSLVINGGTLIVGDPYHSGMPGAWSLREQDDNCECGYGPYFTVDQGSGATNWKGFHIKSGSIAFIYGADFTYACTPIKVEGDHSPSWDWCSEPANSDGSAEFVWVECCTFMQPVDSRGYTTCEWPHAAIYLHGASASNTILNRLGIFGANYPDQWTRGVMVHGDTAYGPVRGPYLTSIYIEEPLSYGVQVSQPDSNATCDINDVTTYTEAVAAGIRVESPGLDGSGIKVYGSARLRFTECEGGLDVYNSQGNSITVDGARQHYGAGVNGTAGLYFDEHLTRLLLVDPAARNIWAERNATVTDSGYCSNMMFYQQNTGPNRYQIYADSNSHVFFSHDSTATLLPQERRWMVQHDSVAIGYTGNRLYADASSSISIVRAWWSDFSSDSADATASTYSGTMKLGTAANILIRDTAHLGGNSNGEFEDNLLWYCDPTTGSQKYFKTQEEVRQAIASSPHSLEVYPNPAKAYAGADGASITFTLQLAEESFVEANIYSQTGEKIQTIASDSWRGRGGHMFLWDGTSSQGRAPAAGRYYIAVRTAQGLNVEPVVIIR